MFSSDNGVSFVAKFGHLQYLLYATEYCNSNELVKVTSPRNLETRKFSTFSLSSKVKTAVKVVGKGRRRKDGVYYVSWVGMVLPFSFNQTILFGLKHMDKEEVGSTNSLRSRTYGICIRNWVRWTITCSLPGSCAICALLITSVECFCGRKSFAYAEIRSPTVARNVAAQPTATVAVAV